MTLLFVADQLKFGGAERHLVALATGLAQRGHKVAVAYLKDSAELAPDLEKGGVAPLFCCHAKGGVDMGALKRLTGLIDDLAPDLVIATSQYSQMCATMAGWRARRRPPQAFICHSMGVVRRGASARLRFIVYRQFYRTAACVIFISELQRGFFAKLGVGLRRSEVVHNGVDLGHFSAGLVAQQASALRAQHGVKPHELVIGLCAIFREEKRHGDLLDALARLRAQGVAARAVLVGDGVTRAQIEARIDALGLREAVLLAGFQQDVRPFIGMCDVMTLTSHDENFPIATLEYMALGKPLVSSDVGGMREQVEDGVNGLLYPAGDVNALTAALTRLSDPALCARLGQGALASVRARFDVQHMITRYETIFRGLAGVRAAAATPTTTA
ncbi:glycosyltransferase family 4 protein [Massilia violaceinigra]|uniref:Glycosyltransferase family 4 protein n=1 Tax=Massilia violaceinigra TaxID=2045208 RepID=A0ABY4A5C2_9BURK|nr:glycosyltransferase family 4 protein [Massilia violaceinigra]UOD27833.1 glycosyltransferase family 4 protein [Massilia violaceinigra]